MSELKILLVDNEPTVVEAMQIGLGMIGYDVETALSGRDALQALETKHFDVILLDLIMPEMNGIEVLQKIKKTGCNSKIFILTAYASDDALEEAIDEGATGYILKPSSAEQIGAIIANSISGN